jgi:hypothetical protein
MSTIDYRDPSLLAALVSNGIMSAEDKAKLNSLGSAMDGYATQFYVDSHLSTIETSVINETNRAVGVENTEINRATGVENIIKTTLDGYTTKIYVDGYASTIKGLITTETNRAISVENTIKTTLDGYALKASVSLDGYALKTSLDGYASKAALDGYTTKFYVDGYASTIKGLITTETNRAIGVENTIKAALDGYGNGSGDVVGPSSATDSAIAIYNSTTGKLIKNSLVTIDGYGNINTPGNVDGYNLPATFANIYSTVAVPGPTGPMGPTGPAGTFPTSFLDGYNNTYNGIGITVTSGVALISGAAIQNIITAETNRATGVENTIKTTLDGYASKTILDGYTTKVYVDGYASTIKGLITTETNRATGVENTIKTALDGYALKTTLDGYSSKAYVDGYASTIKGLITTETNRATGVENTIKTSLDGYSAAITAETNRATGVENTIKTTLDGYASAQRIKTLTNTVYVAGSAAPSDGYVLMATGASTAVWKDPFNKDPTVQYTKKYGAFIINGAGSKILTFSTLLHGATPKPGTLQTGKFLLGFTGNSANQPSAGCAIEFLTGVFINLSGNIDKTFTSLGPSSGYPVGDASAGTANSFMSINYHTISDGYTALLGLIPIITIFKISNTDYKITIEAPLNINDANFYWTYEYGGIFL